MTVTLSNTKASIASGQIAVTELDGTPLANTVSTIKFSIGAVTDNGDGSVSVVTGVGGGGDTSTNTSTSVDGEATLFSGTGGKTLKRSTLTGMLKSASGVLQVASVGTDYPPITSGTSILKGNGSGGFSLCVAGTEYLAPAGSGAALTGITPTQIGLSNVTNTSDANKPVSTAQQTALDLKAPIAGPSFTGNVNILLQATENVVIDGRTNPRTSLTTGVLRINHTAGKTGTRPLALDVNCAGFADTHAISVNYIATGLGIGSENHGYDFSVDTDNSTGGDISAMSVSSSGVGTINVTAVEAYPGINVIEQEVGVTSVADANFTYSGGAYTDATTAFGSSGTNVNLFVADTDYVYLGNSLKFGIVDITLSVFATGNGVQPTFEYSTSGGGGWTTFSPGDTTNGFRQNGTIAIPTLSSWVTSTVNGVTGKYWIRIRRSNAAAITVPTESTIKIVISSICSWNKLGAVHITNLNVSSLGIYANNAAAVTGGLVVGDIYRTSGGSLNIVV